MLLLVAGGAAGRGSPAGPRCLGGQPLVARRQVVEDPDQVGLAGRRQAVGLRGRAHLQGQRRTRAGRTAAPITAWARVARGRSATASRRRTSAPAAVGGRGSRSAGSSPRSASAHARNSCRRIAAALAKIRIAEDDDHARGQLGAHAELVAEEHDQRGDQHVGDERDDEHPVVEDPVEGSARRAEHGVERGDDGDRQVRLQPQRARSGAARGPATMPTTSPRTAITAGSLAPRVAQLRWRRRRAAVSRSTLLDRSTRCRTPARACAGPARRTRERSSPAACAGRRSP